MQNFFYLQLANKTVFVVHSWVQGSYSIEKPLNLTASLKKSLNFHKALKSPWIVTEVLEKFLNF